MYLKRLELQGFKSFRTRTLFEFGPGVTAVIGPNGSGKSNVAESIRWVLGEQHTRSLRARRLEDVIFSGSSQRAAVGMAEVAMTLDNAEGWLPVDYSEVVVSRRVYRDGDSEYLINKNKVRLRDVIDLFMRAQVGQNSYAFMGQGLVEEVLLMRPEERRRLLEEAADVRLLRTRLDEARDRLSATRENLDRVNMLLEEIGPRLRQLERQASRAAEHGKLAAELAQTLKELYNRLWQDAQAAHIAARSAVDQKRQALAEAQQAAQATEEALTTLTRAIEERERELGRRRGRRRAASDTVHALTQRLSLDAERVTSLERRRTEAETELRSLRTERAELHQALTRTQERRHAIQPEIENAKHTIETRRMAVTEQEQAHTALRRRIADLEDRIERAKRGAREADTSLARLEEAEKRGQAERERRSARRRALATQLGEVRLEHRQFQTRISALEAEIATGDAEHGELAATLEAGRAAVQELEREALQAEAAVTQLRGQETVLRGLQAAAGGADAAVRFLLGQDGEGTERRHAAEGIAGLMREIVRVPQGMERAIEAALAENAQALVLENMPAALAALERLERNEAGRAVLLPLDAVKTTPPLNLLRERGFIGVAARLVRCDARFRPLVDVLLGRVIVVDSLALARDVLRRGLGAVVTLDGVLLRPNGAIAGGVNRATLDSFDRRRELEALPEQIEKAEAQQQTIETRLQAARETLETDIQREAALTPRLTALKDERSRLQTSAQENRGRLILLRSEAKSLRTGEGGGEDEARRRARHQGLETEKAQLESEAEEAARALVQEREALAALTPQRNALVDAVSEATSVYVGLEGEERSLARQIETAQANLTRCEQRLQSREAALVALNEELGQLRNGRTTAEQELAAAREELSALQAELGPAESEFSQLQGRMRGLREQATANRARLLEAERANMEAESAFKLRGDEMESLRETMAGEGFRAEGQRVLDEQGAAAYDAARMPPIQGAADVAIPELRNHVAELRRRIRALGPVNEQAHADYMESRERFDFLQGQVDDLTGSEEVLQAAISELETNIRERLKETFAVVEREFARYFTSFFGGGEGRLTLTRPDDLANTGIDIVAQPPGKRVNAIALLSGGERTLTALALLLALLEANPSPICVLDEVDAALDETNVGRFVEAVRVLGQRTQFIIITHNPRTIEAADSIYGVSMGSDSTSSVLSLRLDELKN